MQQPQSASQTHSHKKTKKWMGMKTSRSSGAISSEGSTTSSISSYQDVEDILPLQSNGNLPATNLDEEDEALKIFAKDRNSVRETTSL